MNFLQIESDVRVFLLMATVINNEELGETEMSRFVTKGMKSVNHKHKPCC